MIQTNSRFVSEIRDMWRYLAASSLLLAVTLLCIASTGQVDSHHRRLTNESLTTLETVYCPTRKLFDGKVKQCNLSAEERESLKPGTLCPKGCGASLKATRTNKDDEAWYDFDKLTPEEQDQINAYGSVDARKMLEEFKTALKYFSSSQGCLAHIERSIVYDSYKLYPPERRYVANELARYILEKDQETSAQFVWFYKDLVELTKKFPEFFFETLCVYPLLGNVGLDFLLPELDVVLAEINKTVAATITKDNEFGNRRRTSKDEPIVGPTVVATLNEFKARPGSLLEYAKVSKKAYIARLSVTTLSELK